MEAVFDTGSFYTIIRENCIPEGTLILRPTKERFLGTAKQGSKIAITGSVHLEIDVNGRPIEGEAFVCPDMTSELIIGAGIMQMWNITTRNVNGQTAIDVGRDRNDPHIQTVL